MEKAEEQKDQRAIIAGEAGDQDVNQANNLAKELSNPGVELSDPALIGSNDSTDRKMEGFLVFRKRVRRRRYCILQGQTLLVFKSKPSDLTSPGAPKKQITVVGVKDAIELEASVRVALLGNGAPGSYDNTFVISSHKSKLVVVEADTHIEKERWLHAISTIYLTSGENEKAFIQSMLSEAGFDAHMAVTLLHKHRANAVATELILDRLASYAEQNVDDVEFYIQQIVHLTVNTELAATDKLVHLLLSICRAKAYVEHLGNCIHLALQLFWLLEAKIADNDPKTYNLCAKLLMSIEAKVVNQQFELPSTQTADDVTRRLMDIPHMKEKLEQMTGENQGDIEAKEPFSRPAEIILPVGNEESSLLSPPMTPSKAGNRPQQPALLLQWMEKERLKRYKYFHQQRDFVKALSDISERMRAIDPPQNRKKLLPDELKALVIPDMAYVPLGRVSDPFCRITRVLTDEGTVFSTHSRAPCLLCFEVIEDRVNSAGHRRLSTELKEFYKSLHGPPSDSALANQEAEVASLLQKFAINGQLISVENPLALDEDEDYEAEIGTDEFDNLRPSDPQVFDLESALSSPSSTVASDELMDSISEMSGETTQNLSLIRGYSKTAYEMGLSKLLSASETITDAQSLDALKNRSTYGGLRAHFESTYGSGDAFKTAQRNFLHSLAAYSVVCYLLQIKDRHNGNILLDTEGHLVHIDFGFMLGIAPGGNWSFETAPFKLTKEMVTVLGGVSSPLFGEFVQLVALGMLAAQRHAEKVVALVEIMMHNSTFPCFQGRDVSRDLQKLRSRFLLHCSTEKTVKAVVKMVRASYKNKWTKRYDQFQKITNGIIP
ncbi:unnamed protein product [Phytophthora lilii]|uniref:1-phosphatidylinositol 4-kinase n=1 Tax=Phytophthora lilii TaxID=2077276 RepID=A0A9W6WLY2_9STRA|nr:unnamed protein product [Phytophthora lilii]